MTVSPTTIDRAQASKAVNALLKHHAETAEKREETELLSREEHVWLVINTKRGTTKKKLMPKRIQLPHPPMPPPPATTVAIITKPPQRQYKDLLASPEHNIKFINRVVDTDKLRGKWKPYEARRNLMRENDIWLADERIVPSLPKLLGKTFFQAKKVPIPVNLKRKDLKAELGRAINSTYYHPSTGTSHSIRISTADSTSASDTLDNLLAAAPAVVELIDDQWDNVMSIGIKTSSSVLLPIYNSKLEGRFDVKEKASADGDVAMSPKKTGKDGKKKRSADEVVVDKADKAEKKSKAGKKAVVEEEAEEAEKPKADKAATVEKKVKATKADKLGGKKEGKKSSSLGSGSAGKRAKEAILGKKK